MNIVHMVDVLVIGGLETYLSTLLNGLSENNNVHLIGQYISKEMRDSLSNNVKVFEKKMDIKAYQEYIKDNNIEIIHCHPHDALQIGTDIADNLILPVVCTYHGLWGWNYQVHNKINKLLAVSTEVYNILLQDNYPLEKLEIIQNGIDSKKIFCKNLINKDNTILFIGRLDTDKYYSLTHIIKAMENMNIKLYVAGMGSHYDQLKAEVPQWVIMLGFIQNINDVVNDASIVISTGRGIREAMLCGKSCISMDACWYDGIVNESSIKDLEYSNFSGRSNGKVPITEEVVKRDILKLLDKNEQIRIGSWAKDYALNNYVSDDFIDKHITLYKNIIEIN